MSNATVPYQPVGPGNKEDHLPFTPQYLQLLAHFFGYEGVVWLLGSHVVEMSAEVGHGEVAISVRNPLDGLPYDLLPRPSHLR